MVSLFSHFHMVNAVLLCTVVAYVCLKGRMRSLIAPFTVIVSLTVIWQLADYLAYAYRDNLSLRFFWEKNAFTALVCIPVALYYLSLAISGIRLARWQIALLFLPALFLSCLVRVDALIAHPRAGDYSVIPTPGPFFLLWPASCVVFFAMALTALWKQHKRTRLLSERERIKHGLLGLLLIGLSAPDIMTFYGLPLPPLGFMFVTFGILILAMSIFEEEPMEVGLVLNKLLGYAGVFALFLTILFLMAYLLCGTSLIPLISGSLYIIMMCGLFAFVILSLLLPLRETIAHYLDRKSPGSGERLEPKIEEFSRELGGYYDMDQLLEKVVHFFHKTLGFDRASFYLLDETRNVYRVFEGDVLGNSATVIAGNDMFIKWLTANKEIVIREEVEGLCRFAQVKEPILTIFDKLDISYCIPLSFEARNKPYLMGMIFLKDSRSLDFRKKWNRMVMENLKKDISSLLFQALMSRKRDEELVLISRFRQKVATSETVEEVLRYVVNNIRELLKVERISIMLLDEDDNTRLVIRDSYGIPQDIVDSVSIAVNDDKKVSGWVYRHKRALITDDVDQLFDLQDGRDPKQYNTKSLISVPILISGEPIGVINANNKVSGEPFDRVDLEVLKGLANESATSIIWAKMRQVDFTRVENLVRTLAKTLEAKDPFTQGHADRVSEYAGYIAGEMKLSMEEYGILLTAGILHDVGKIGIPDSILLKPGKLTDEEFAIIKGHSKAGEEILRQANISEEILLGVKHHHERYDGRGYPDGLRGEAIPLLARILAVADAFDAMMSNRAYRKKMKFSAVKEQIEKNRGTQFDPLCADFFLKWLNENAPADEDDIDQIELTGHMQQRAYVGTPSPASPGGVPSTGTVPAGPPPATAAAPAAAAPATAAPATAAPATAAPAAAAPATAAPATAAPATTAPATAAPATAAAPAAAASSPVIPSPAGVSSSS
jgi:HD-GYP domain-containing protein (c-di-GMP phosphodiesterase class II)